MQIIFHDVSADYQLGPIRSKNVLQSVNLKIESGSFTALIGHTGAGKSSLLKAMNGLLMPVKGEIQIGNRVIKSGENKKSWNEIRKRVGIVFQFPESQLFAETVEKDICFGPLNFGVPIEEAKEITRNVIKLVGLDPSILTKSPFSLSGGQKRRVAIAGILAMEPQVLILDEPGAGLDPQGKKEILSLIADWHHTKKLTTILVTHDMEDVVQFAEKVMVMHKGEVVMHDEVKKVFSDKKRLQSWNLEVPKARHFQLIIEKKKGIKLPGVCLTMEELAEGMIKVGLV